MIKFGSYLGFLNIKFVSKTAGILLLGGLVVFLASCAKKKPADEAIVQTGTKVVTFAGNPSGEGDVVSTDSAVKGNLNTPTGIDFDSNGVLNKLSIIYV